MTCKELIDFLDDYFAGEQPQAVRSAFEQHLSICPHCREYLDGYREAVRLGKESCKGEEQAAAIPESLVRAILDARARGG